MGIMAAFDRFITRSAYEAGKRQDAERHRIRERDAKRSQQRIAAGLEVPIKWGVVAPRSEDKYSLVDNLKQTSLEGESK